MRKTIKIIVIVLLLGVFFLFPFIPNTLVYRTQSQKQKQIEICRNTGGHCAGGLIYSITPFMYIKTSIKNFYYIDKLSDKDQNLLDGLPSVTVPLSQIKLDTGESVFDYMCKHDKEYLRKYSTPEEFKKCL